MRVAIYVRVSTKDQTTANQRMALEKVAAQRGWTIVQVYEDAGISGAKGRDKRPAFDAMIKAAMRRDVDLIAAWSVDRLGRSLAHLVTLMDDLNAVGCGLYLDQQSLDTTTPSGRAMFGMVGVFAQFEREMIRERVHAGIDRARASGKTLGRPKVNPATEAKVRELRSTGMGKVKIGKTLKIGTNTVQRILEQEAA